MQHHETGIGDHKLISICDTEQDLILAHFCGLERGDLPERYMSQWLGEFLVGLNDWCASCTLVRSDLPDEPMDEGDEDDEWSGWQDIRVSEAVEFLSKHKVGINPEAW